VRAVPACRVPWQPLLGHVHAGEPSQEEAATALLIAAKRADAIASEVALHTEKNTEELKSLMQENTALTLQVKAYTDLLEEIHRHVTALGAPP